MTISCGFFNSLNGDRRYNAEQMSALFDGIINDGVFQSVGTAFEVKALEASNVTVGIGRCWFNSTWLYNDSVLPLLIDGSDVVLDRIDAVVIEIDHTDEVRKGTIKIVKGTPSSTPEPPTLIKTDKTNQYPLAYVKCPAGSTSVSQANITNKIGTSDCPYVNGILEVQDIDKIVAQWDAEFKEWFGDLQVILEGDVAANLAARILALEDKTSKVGDTLTTSRTDLDDCWLLCNGASVERSKYPDLSPMFASSPSDNYINNDIIKHVGDFTSTFYDFKYLNGYYVAVGKNGNDAILVYSTSPDGLWTTKVLWTNTEAFIKTIEYINGYYIVGGHYKRSEIAFSTSLDGPWTLVPANVASYFANSYECVNSIAYNDYDGYYHFCGGNLANSASSYVACSYYCKDLSSLSSFTSYNTIGSVGSYRNSYANGMVFDGQYYIAAVTTNDKAFLYKGFIGDGVVDKSKVIWGTSKSEVNFIKRINGLYIVGGCEYKNSSYNGVIGYTAGDPMTDTFTTVDVFPNGTSGTTVNSITFENGLYIVSGNISTSTNTTAYIAYSASLDGPWAIKEMWSGSHFVAYEPIYTANNIYKVAYANGLYFAAGNHEWDSRLAVSDTKFLTLPSISLSNQTYTYIKAKE